MTTIHGSQEETLRDATRRVWESLMGTDDGGEGGENDVDAAAAGAAAGFDRSPLHGDCAVFLLLDEGGTFVTGRPAAMEWPPALSVVDGPLRGDGIVAEHVKILPVGGQSAATVQVRVPGSSYHLRGFFVFLKEGGKNETGGGTIWTWKCISIALAPARPGGKMDNNQVLPIHYSEVNALTWDGYCHANRLCDGKLMARHFHPTCRLTYTSPADGRIVTVDSDTFLDLVEHRYTRQPAHVPYATLRDVPEVGDSDSLQSIEFVTPQLTMVTLRVGHPPFLWTDLLTCARIRSTSSSSSNIADTGDCNAPPEMAQHKWWIVHKSSECEPHPLAATPK